MKMRTCPKCDGEGHYHKLYYGDWVEHEPTTCERCNGEGEIEAEEIDDDYGHDDENE